MRKIILIIAGFILFLILISSIGGNKASTLPASTMIPTATPTPIPTIIVTPTPSPDQGLSNDKYYINSNGNEVHSPAYSNTVPDGATAICRDGTYSFSQHRRGTCSYHGGVAQWL